MRCLANTIIGYCQACLGKETIKRPKISTSLLPCNIEYKELFDNLRYIFKFKAAKVRNVYKLKEN